MFDIDLKWMSQEDRVKKLNEIFSKDFADLNIKAPNDIINTGNIWGWLEFVKPASMVDYIITMARIKNPLWTKVRNVIMGSASVVIPVEWVDPQFNLSTESTDSAACAPCTPSLAWTQRVSLNAKNFCAKVLVTQSEMEDSWPDIMQYIMDKLVLAYNDTIDNILINGDIQVGTTNINFNGAAIPTNDVLLSSDGIRKVALANTKTVNAWVLDSVDIMKARSLLWLLGMDNSNLLLIPSPDVYYRLYLLSQNTNWLTPAIQGTFNQGQLETLQAIPLHTTVNYAKKWFGKMLASGIVSSTLASNTTGGMALIHKDRVIRWTRRDLKIFVMYLPNCDSYEITATFRGAGIALPEWVATLVNVDLS